MVKQVGTVKWFNPIKGYGFIQPDGGGADIFVHARDVQESGVPMIKDKQRVAFVLSGEGQRGGRVVATQLEVL